MLSHNQEKLIKSLYSIHGRKKNKKCICEGLRVCTELLEADPNLLVFALKIEELSLPKIFEDVDFINISSEKMKEISTTVSSQGILFVTEIPKIKTLNAFDEPFVVLLDRVSDPGNLGTIIRTVKAIGLKNIFLTTGSADPFGDKVIRSAMAGQFHLNIQSFQFINDALCEFRKFGFKNVYRTDCHQGISIFEEKNLFEKSVIIFGGEAAGVPQIENTNSITIPMPGNSESINVAQAATVCLFEAVRRDVISPS